MIRPVAPDEYEALGELTVAAYRAAGETDEPYYPFLRDVAARATAATVLVAVDAATGELLGGVTYVAGSGPYAEGNFGDAATFRMLAVAPEARGRGVGRALVEAVIATARADGKPAIGIFTRPFMTAAQGLYASLGFKRVPALDWEFAPAEWLLAYRLELPVA
jgi:ribosomal protein S18 acetylase RimI-like enzyme